MATLSRKWRFFQTFLTGLSERQLLSLVLVLVILVSGASTLTLLIKESYQDRLYKSLGTVLATTDNGIRVWYRENKLTALNFTQNKELQQAVSSLLQLPARPQPLLDSPAQAQLRQIFLSQLQSGQYRGYFIIGPGNISLASSRDRNIGSLNLLAQYPDLMDKLWAGQPVISPIMPTDVPLVEFNQPEQLETMFVGAPIKNPQGQVIALLTFRIDPHNTLFPLLNQGRLGDSGETYAFDRQGLMLNPSRFQNDLEAMGLVQPAHQPDPGETIQEHLQHSRIYITDPGVDLRIRRDQAIAPSERSLTLMAANAVAGESGMNMDGYRDYRGVPVIGVWLWDEVLNLGLASEQDVAEAYDLYYFVRTLIITGSILTVLMIILLTYFFAAAQQKILSSTKRIKGIVETANDAIITIDSRGIIESVNPAAEKMFGLPASVLLKTNVSVLMPGRYGRHHDGYLRHYLNTGEAKIIGVGRETSAKHADGSEFPIELSINRMDLDNGTHFAGIIRDITRFSR